MAIHAEQLAPASPADDRYFALVRAFPLRPIKSEVDLQGAIAVLDSLLDRRDRTEAEDDYLDVLGDLVEKYEDEHVPMPSLTDADLLRNLIENRGLTSDDVSAGTGISAPALADLLAGNRVLDRAEIESLARFCRVKPSIFFA
ncbi:MAG: putative transcription regulator containing domain [Planctomycetota bacterium]|nr:putative transcription regulator containing domain [Planctomycetota bacterium]